MSENVIDFEQRIALKKAVVIDDAFDQVYAVEVPFEEFRAFYTEANQDEVLDKILDKLEIGKPNLTEWDDNSPDYETYLRKLWIERDNQQLRPLIYNERLFAKRLDNIDELTRLCNILKSKDFEVKEMDSVAEEMNIFESGEYLYVFIDYNLGIQVGDEAVKNAQRIAKKIYDTSPKDKKPITILMSSDPREQSVVEKFQEDAEWVEGVFRFSPKSDLINSEKVSLLIRAYQEEFVSNHKLQAYIHTLIKAAQNAQKSFKKDVMKLKVEDYEYMHNSILKDSQQPLGDYLAWLYGTHWISLLLRDNHLKEQQDALDTIIAEKKPLHYSMPSKNISKIFMTALYEEGRDSLSHPWYNDTEEAPSIPYLHLGDVFASANSERVHMIINPQCDLERPSKIGKDSSVFIIPGILDPIENQIINDKLKTEFFMSDNKQYRIYWDINCVHTVMFKDFREWVKAHQLMRKHRLRLPFALEIQRRFTSNLSRVGLPVSPPLFGNIYLSVGFKSFDNSIIENFLIKSDSYCFIPLPDLSKYDSKREKEDFRLTLEFALDFNGTLGEELLKLKNIAGQETVPKGVVKLIEKLDTGLPKFEDWFFQNKSFNKPKKENEPTILIPDFLSLVWSDVDQATIKTPLWITIYKNVEKSDSVEISALPDSKCTV